MIEKLEDDAKLLKRCEEKKKKELTKHAQCTDEIESAGCGLPLVEEDWHALCQGI